MREEAVVIPVAAAIGMFFIVYFGERAFKSVIIEVLAGLGMKSSQSKDANNSPLATRSGDPLRAIMRKRSWLWHLRHGQKPWR